MYDKNELKTLSRKELGKTAGGRQKKRWRLQELGISEMQKKPRRRRLRSSDFSLNDIAETAAPLPKKTKTKAKAVKKQSKPVFFNPEDKTQTWTGKGRQPIWYREQIATGTDPDDMRIKN